MDMTYTLPAAAALQWLLLKRFGLLNLRRQRIQIHQQKIRQPLHVNHKRSGRFFIAMQRFVAIHAQLMRPRLQGGRNQVVLRHPVNALFQLPRFDIRRKFSQGQLKALPQYGSRRREAFFLPIKVVARFLVQRGNVCGDMLRRIWHDGCRLYPLYLVALPVLNIAPQRLESAIGSPPRLDRNGSVTARTGKHNVACIIPALVLGHIPEPYAAGSAARAIMHKDSHDNS